MQYQCQEWWSYTFIRLWSLISKASGQFYFHQFISERTFGTVLFRINIWRGTGETHINHHIKQSSNMSDLNQNRRGLTIFLKIPQYEIS
jgi:hypothetical protein